MLAKIEKRPFVRQKQCPVCPQSGHLIGLQRMAAESPHKTSGACRNLTEFEHGQSILIV